MASQTIHFKAKLLSPQRQRGKAVSWSFLKLPAAASVRLPSRNMVSIEGTFNDFPFRTTLEPDGEGGHWMKVDRRLRCAAGAEAGDVVSLVVAPAQHEPEPPVPADFRKSLANAPVEAREVWSDITAIARRDYIHWITSAKQAQTRARRIATACDMLVSGKRRPCCFDRSGKFARSLSCPVAEGPSRE